MAAEGSDRSALQRSIAWLIVYAMVSTGLLGGFVLPSWYHDGLSATSVLWTLVLLAALWQAWRHFAAIRAARRRNDAGSAANVSVVLVAAGPSKLTVIEILRSECTLGLGESQRLADHGGVVASGLTSAQADHLVAALNGVGASARRESPDPRRRP